MASFKVGTKVKFVRRNGQKAEGKVSGAEIAGAKGSFVPVLIEGGVTYKIRPSQLTAA